MDSRLLASLGLSVSGFQVMSIKEKATYMGTTLIFDPTDSSSSIHAWSIQGLRLVKTTAPAPHWTIHRQSDRPISPVNPTKRYVLSLLNKTLGRI